MEKLNSEDGHLFIKVSRGFACRKEKEQLFAVVVF
jgi:hypothetical protein